MLLHIQHVFKAADASQQENSEGSPARELAHTSALYQPDNQLTPSVVSNSVTVVQSVVVVLQILTTEAVVVGI